MKKILICIALFITPSLVWSIEGSNKSLPLNKSEWKKFIPVIRDFDSEKDKIERKTKYTFSQHRTRKYSVQESDLSITPYNKSIAIITIHSAKEPLSIIEIKSYKNYSVNWLNEELIHIQTWPGKCVQIDEVLNINTENSIYSSSLYHCGVRK